MIQYASTHRCRRQMILDYFGDETPVADCRCDVCRSGQPSEPAAGTAIVSDELKLLVRRILSGVARCHGRFGVGVVAEMLAGIESERTQKWGLQDLTTFGLLRGFPAKKVIAMLHRLLESGLARQRDPDGAKFRPVIELTASGIAVMKGEHNPPASLEDLVPRRMTVTDFNTDVQATPRRRTNDPGPDLAADPAAAERFETLRALRARIARDSSLPAYVVCHDKVLKQIALEVPSDVESLSRIKGMGPYKVKTYGQAFLDALRG